MLGGSKKGTVQGTVYYYDPNDLNLEVGHGRRVTPENGDLLVEAKSTFAGGVDTESDIAIIRSPSDWADTDNGDYLRLGLGDCNQSNTTLCLEEGTIAPRAPDPESCVACPSSTNGAAHTTSSTLRGAVEPARETRAGLTS